MSTNQTKPKSPKIGSADMDQKSVKPLTDVQRDYVRLDTLAVLRNMQNILQGLVRRQEELLMVGRLTLQVLTRNSPLRIDLGQFQKVGGLSIHPNAWGCMIPDMSDTPDEALYRKYIVEWADMMGIQVELTGVFKVECHDEMIQRLRKFAQGDAEVTEDGGQQAQIGDE